MSDPVILTVDTTQDVVKIRRINPFSVAGVVEQPPPAEVPEDAVVGLMGLLLDGIYYGELVE